MITHRNFRKKRKLAGIMAMSFALIAPDQLLAEDIPTDGIEVSEDKSYVSAGDATITATGGNQGIAVSKGNVDITLNGGNGTLTINKTGNWAPVQVGQISADTASLTVNGNLVINSSSHVYYSEGTIQGLDGGYLHVTGDLTVKQDYPFSAPTTVNSSLMTFEGSSAQIDGNADLGGSLALNNGNTSDWMGMFTGVYASQGNASAPKSDLIFGTGSDNLLHIHDIRLNSSNFKAETYGIHASHEGSDDYLGTQIIVNSRAIIENINAIAQPADQYAYAVGAEANEAVIDFRSGLVIRNIAAVNDADTTPLDSGTRGPNAEAYSLVAMNGGKIYVNSSGNSANVVQIEGDMISVDVDRNNNESEINAKFMNSDSWFRGLTGSYGQPTGQTNLTFGNGAYWAVGQDNTLQGTLNLQKDGRVYVGEMASFSGTDSPFGARSPVPLTNPATLTIGKLTGSGGIFYLRADIDQDTADRIVVKQGDGSHYLMVKSTGNEPTAQRMNTYLARLENGSANFAVANTGGKVDAGTYQYILKEETTSTGKGWYLAQDDGSTPVPPDPDTGPETPPDPQPEPFPEPQPPSPDRPPVKNLSPAASTALSFQNVSYQARMVQVNNLNLRTRDLRTNAFSDRSVAPVSSGTNAAQSGFSSIALNGWANSFGQTGHFQSYGGSRYDQNVYGISLGIDKKFREKDAVWYLGVRGQYSKADQKLDGDIGRGDGNSKGAALYGVWIHRSGWYANGILAADHYHQNLKARQSDGTNAEADYRVWGYGANLEIGKHIPLINHFFVEPQLAVDYYRVNGSSFAYGNGLRIAADATNYLSTRAGLRAGQQWQTGNGRYLEYFVKGGVSHEFMSEQRLVSNNTYEFKDNLKGNRLFYGAEISGSLSKHVRLFGQIEREKGHDFDTDWTFSAGVRLSFN